MAATGTTPRDCTSLVGLPADVFVFRLGQLGHGDRVSRSTPRLIRALRGTTVVQIAAGVATAFAISAVRDVDFRHLYVLPLADRSLVVQDGSLYSWGSGAKGETGLRYPGVVMVQLPHMPGGVSVVFYSCSHASVLHAGSDTGLVSAEGSRRCNKCGGVGK